MLIRHSWSQAQSSSYVEAWASQIKEKGSLNVNLAPEFWTLKKIIYISLSGHLKGKVFQCCLRNNHLKVKSKGKL